MQITKEWLDKAILIDKKIGNYSISKKQTELLYKWFPDLFYSEEGKTEKSFVKHWNIILCGKSITDVQATQFIKAKMDAFESPHAISELLKIIIDRGLEFCKNTYGKDPEHPQLRLISLIGHMEGVKVQEVNFHPMPTDTTRIRFYFQATPFDDPINYFVICNSSKLFEINGKKCPETILYKELPREIIGPGFDIHGDKVKDCTGLEITECINEFRPKKKVVVVRKIVKPKPIKKSPMFKAMEKSIDKFQKDYASINEKRAAKNLDPISLIDFAAAFDIDIKDTLSVLKYNPSAKDLNKFLK